MTSPNTLRLSMQWLMVILSVALLFGCTPKVPMRTTVWVHEEQTPLARNEQAAFAGDSQTGQRSKDEQRLRDQRIREETLGDSGTQRTVLEAGGGEPLRQEPATLRKLQISDIIFGFNEYRLTTESQEVLRAAAAIFLEHPHYLLVIEGHCDKRGTVEYNLALGQKRADEAAAYLVNLGVAKERIKTISYGKERPLDHGDDEAAFAKNRRAHFIVVPPVTQR